MHPRLLLLLPLLLCYLAATANGINGNVNEIKFRHINTGQGLSNTSGTAFAQDDEGFVWIGTRNGLNRYDGINFEVFQHDETNPNSISNNRIETIYTSSKGQLWIGTDYGLNLLLPDGGFRKFLAAEDGAPGHLSNNIIFSICEDAAGNLWIGTREGLNYLDTKTYEFTTIRHDEDNPASPGSDFIKAVYVDTKDILWIVTNKGVDKQTAPGALTFTHYINGMGEAREANLPTPSALLEAPNGDIWVGMASGLWKLPAGATAFENVELCTDGQQDGQLRRSVRDILLDESGNLWAGTYEGLFVLSLDDGTCSHFVHNRENPYSLSQNSIHSLYQDQAGNFWVGTWSGAVNYLDRDYGYFTHYGTFSGLSYHVVSSFSETANGNLWIGTEGGGLDYLDRTTGRFVNYRNQPGVAHSLPSNNVQGFVRRRNGDLAVVTHGGGLSIMPADRSGYFRHYRHDPDRPESLSSDNVASVLEDSHERLWIATSLGSLNLLNNDGKTFAKFTTPDGKDYNTRTIYEDKQQRIWVGTNLGLGLVNQADNTVDFAALSELNAALHSLILCIYQSEDNAYWIGTEEDGLFRLSPDFTQITNFRTSDGMPNNTIFGILPDDSGHLWFSTNMGLARMDLATDEITTYDIANGLQSNEFNYDAYYRTARGELLFGGVNGFNIFDPGKIKRNEYQPPVAITGFQVKEDPMAIPLDENGQPQTIELAYNQTPFSFDFVALNYTQPDKNRFAYLLEGHDEEWLEIGNRRHRTFTNIDPGTYTFKVRAANNDGVWSDQIATLQLRIFPPPWRTWWAYLLYLAAVVGLVTIAYHYYRVRAADRNALKREIMEREKMEELNHLKMQFFTNVSHELRTPLTLIMGPLEHLLAQAHAFSGEQKAELKIVHRNAQRLLQHVNHLMDFRKEEMGKLKLKAAAGNFINFIKETSLSFQEVATHRQIEYTFSADRDLAEVYFDRDKMEIIIFNLLSNAFKFTSDGGRIALDVSVCEDEFGEVKDIQVAVRDNGTGISAEDQPHLFDRFYQGGSRNDPERRGSGIGLALTKQLVDLHRGEISVRSREGEGSEFIVRLPLGRDHLSPDEVIGDFKPSDDLSHYNRQDDKENITLPATTKEDRETTLLVIEDNNEIREFIADCFRGKYQVITAADGAEGFDLATHQIPDLIISDIMMPEIDGITLCGMLKKDLRTSHIPVVLLTARTSVIFKRSGLESGADDYITKPFTAKMLLLRVHNLLQARKKMQAFFVRNFKTNPEEVVLSSHDDEFLQKALTCVEENLDNSDFNVEAFVKLMYISRSVLYKKLKGLTGQSITEFVRSIRIKRAAQLLLQGRYNISEVAYSVGFSDLKYFRTSFKKQFQMTPSQYIAAHKAAKGEEVT